MTDGVRIRDALPEEALSIIQLWRTAFAEADAHGEIDDVRRVILNSQTARLLVATVDSAIIGTLIVTFDGWRGHFYRLAVLPEHRRQGVARLLLAAAESWLGGLGCTRARATVVMQRPWATGFWEAAGYTADSASYVLKLPRSA